MRPAQHDSKIANGWGPAAKTECTLPDEFQSSQPKRIVGHDDPAGLRADHAPGTIDAFLHVRIRGVQIQQHNIAVFTDERVVLLALVGNHGDLELLAQRGSEKHLKRAIV